MRMGSRPFQNSNETLPVRFVAQARHPGLSAGDDETIELRAQQRVNA